jgi:hypothetical protein
MLWYGFGLCNPALQDAEILKLWSVGGIWCLGVGDCFMDLIRFVTSVF